MTLVIEDRRCRERREQHQRRRNTEKIVSLVSVAIVVAGLVWAFAG